MRSISEIEKELEFVTRVDDENWMKVQTSDRPEVEEFFAVSTLKRRSILQRELAEAKAERAHELFELKIHAQQFSPGTISLRLLSKLSAILNDAIEQAAWREWDVIGDDSGVDEGFRKLINLRLAGIRSGSTELVFLGNTAPDLTGDSALESGLKNLFSVLSASNHEIPDMVNTIGSRATKSVMHLMKELESENIGVEFSWSAPDTKYNWDGRPEQITRIRALLEEFGDSRNETIEVKGVISSLSRKRIHIETINGQNLSVRYHASLSNKVKSLHLDQSCNFTIEEITYPSDKIGIKRSAYTLKDIQVSV